MKNLMKKTLCILTALMMLVICASAFADDENQPETQSVQSFKIGKGVSGTLQPGQPVKVKAKAGQAGQATFTLALTEDCSVSVTVNGAGVSLSKPNGGLSVYTFGRNVRDGERLTISITAEKEIGFAISSDLIPEVTEKAEEQEKPSAPAEAQTDAQADAQADVQAEPAADATADPEPAGQEAEQETPEVAGTTADDPMNEPETAEPAGEAGTEDDEQEPTAGGEEGAEQPEQEEPEESEPETEEKVEDDGQEPAEGSEEGTEEPEQQEQPEEPEVSADENETEEQPAEEEGQTEEPVEIEPENDESTGAADSIEIIITKALTPDESWNGTVRNKKATILKLDVAQAGMIHMFVEGKDVCYSVQKSDRVTEDAGKIMTDSETNRSVTSWSAEAGSYLISIYAGSNSLMSKVKVSFKNDEEFAAWEAEQAVPVIEEETPEEDAPEDAKEVPEDAEETENEQEPDPEAERSVFITLSWDTENPKNGDVAHFESTLTGYDGLNYTLQWQTSWDQKTWTDYPAATESNLDVTLTKELDGIYFRLMVFLEEEQEG